MLDQIAEQLTGPADAALEKREAQLREAPGDAAEENRLGGRVTGGGEPSPSVGWRRGLFLLLRQDSDLAHDRRDVIDDANAA